MKKTFKFLLTAVAAIAIAACTPINDPEDTEKPGETPEENTGSGDQKEEEKLNQSIEFTLEVTEVSHDQAKIKVSHNGETKDTWYGFVTSDADGNDATLIAAEIKRMTDEGKISGLKKQKSSSLTIRGLDAKTDYKYIVFGLSDKGEFYGTAASVKFTTTRNKDLMTETQDWKISYQRGENQGQKAEIFTIECEKGKGFYFTTVDTYLLEVNEFTIVDYIKYVIETEVPLLLSYGYKWSDLYVDESYKLAAQRMEHGDYVALAIGYDAEGEPTGFFSSQEFTVVEETAEDAYNQWLGTWDLTSNYQVKDEDGNINDFTTTYTVTLLPYDNNNIYAMTGWEENGSELDIREYVGEYVIPVYYNNGNLEFRETTLDYVEFEESGYYYFGLYGIASLTIEGQTQNVLAGFDEMPMAIGKTEDNGQTGTISGLGQTIQGTAIKYIGMGYFAYNEEDMTSWNGYLPFPMAMTKVTEEQAPMQQSLRPIKDMRISKSLRKSDRGAMIVLE
ncbi:MAG: hypothetical protein IJ504_00490 [Bacteroidales bacterium]|nr:hypothetical protein [Bacteroidales bacterium]